MYFFLWYKFHPGVLEDRLVPLENLPLTLIQYDSILCSISLYLTHKYFPGWHYIERIFHNFLLVNSSIFWQKDKIQESFCREQQDNIAQIFSHFTRVVAKQDRLDTHNEATYFYFQFYQSRRGSCQVLVHILSFIILSIITCNIRHSLLPTRSEM